MKDKSIKKEKKSHVKEVKNKIMKVFKVDEVEHDPSFPDFDLRLDDYYYFETEEKALLFILLYNKKYNVSLDKEKWYMMPVYKGEVAVDEEEYNKRKYKGEFLKQVA